MSLGGGPCGGSRPITAQAIDYNAPDPNGPEKSYCAAGTGHGCRAEAGQRPAEIREIAHYKNDDKKQNKSKHKTQISIPNKSTMTRSIGSRRFFEFAEPFNKLILVGMCGKAVNKSEKGAERWKCDNLLNYKSLSRA